MRSRGVVIIGPGGDRLASMGDAHEQRLIEQLVAHAIVEAFAEAVLRRLVRRDVVPFDAGFVGP